MYRKLIILILFLFLIRLVSGQETDNIKKEKSFSVFVESPLFFSSYVDDYNIYTLNLEYHFGKEPRTSFTFGYGERFKASNWSYSSSVITFGINTLLGGKNHFFEAGAGLLEDFHTHLLTLRVGYRGVFWDRLIVRAAYTPGLPVFYGEHVTGPVDNMLSVGIGYCFGIKTSKEKWDKNWKWLSGMQLNFQPFFKNYKGYEGYYGEVNLEFLLYSSNNISINGIIGFGYGSVKSEYSRFAYNSIPFGVRLLYGRKKHFLEAGVKSAWIPIGGNSDGTFFTLQPELGYRFCPGKHFTARLAYTPYWWLSDNGGKEYVEQNFIHSATIGIGWRFH